MRCDVLIVLLATFGHNGNVRTQFLSDSKYKWSHPSRPSPQSRIRAFLDDDEPKFSKRRETAFNYDAPNVLGLDLTIRAMNEVLQFGTLWIVSGRHRV